jgi:hypothetical protein
LVRLAHKQEKGRRELTKLAAKLRRQAMAAVAQSPKLREKLGDHRHRILGGELYVRQGGENPLTALRYGELSAYDYEREVLVPIIGDLQTGKVIWEIPNIGGGVTGSGVLSTAGGLVFGTTGYVVQNNTLTLSGGGLVVGSGLTAALASQLAGAAGVTFSGGGISIDPRGNLPTDLIVGGGSDPDFNPIYAGTIRILNSSVLPATAPP